ncbi:hypothetical protein K458DRAFT_90143 [Lentithecium fluviatile CBS 122367]|uniref:Uncharacterized protein n=1 Tax=Lentithecium fluviatile CBS 122367 TaxID=1168545 RepID=A0A6G1IQU9_9PLEO|nr:hypothetical protein K458DRAFT_90143 [Lentithecium fluviatile CBS 122367]
MLISRRQGGKQGFHILLSEHVPTLRHVSPAEHSSDSLTVIPVDVELAVLPDCLPMSLSKRVHENLDCLLKIPPIAYQNDISNILLKRTKGTFRIEQLGPTRLHHLAQGLERLVGGFIVGGAERFAEHTVEVVEDVLSLATVQPDETDLGDRMHGVDASIGAWKYHGVSSVCVPDGVGSLVRAPSGCTSLGFQRLTFRFFRDDV